MRTRKGRPPLPRRKRPEIEKAQRSTHLSSHRSTTASQQGVSVRMVVAWNQWPLVLTPRHIADITGCSLNWAYGQLDHGDLRGLSTRIGAKHFIDREKFRRFIEGGA